jgi:signal transduction histidine kinase
MDFGMKPQVFLSYSRYDLHVMQHVKESLLLRGLTVWTDELLEPGTAQWEVEIANAIENSEALIVLLTPAAKESRWVSRELSYAEAHNVRIFPIMVAGTEQTAIPFRLISTQYIDFRNGFNNGMRELGKALSLYLGIEIPSEKVKNAEQMSEFIANSLHDLRTPLSVLMTGIGMLQRYRERMDAARVEELLNRMSDNIYYLNRFVDDIMDVSRLDRQILPAPEMAIEVNNLLSKIVEKHTLLAEEKQVAISFTPSTAEAFVRIDIRQFERAISNLCENAINYTPSGGIVEIAADYRDQVIDISVTDTGMGIPEKDKANIFNRFYRGENANEARPKGTGLGLAIAKEIVEYYGGQITFQSQVDKGTTFIVSFPISPEVDK